MDDAEAGQRAVRRSLVASPVALSALVGVLLCAGCNPRRETETAPLSDASVPRTPDGRALRPVTLPDLSPMVQSAQSQIRARHQTLTRTLENRQTSPLELGNAYGEMGKLLMAAQYADAAEACFLNAQTLDTSDFRWPYYLGHLYRTQGEPAKSRDLFERAIQLRPDDVATLVWLGDVYLSLGLPDAAEPQFVRALSLQDRSLSARFGLGRTALAKHDYRRAATYLEDVLTMDPHASGAHYPLSLAYRALGESKKADQHLRQRRERQILPADPLMVELEELLQSPQTYETLGIRALDREDWAAAAAQFRKGLELAPESPALRHRLGTALNMMGDARGAEEQFDRVVRASPDYFPAQYSLGVILQAKGRHSEAVERFSAAIRQRANYNEARVRLAASLRRLGRTKESLAQYEQVVSANPELSEAQFGYAMALVQLRRYQEARHRLTDGMKSHPDDAIFVHGLARLLASAPDDRVRDGRQAMTLVQELLKQGRTLELGETMAMTLAALGQYEQAASVQRDLMAAAEKAGLTNVVPRLAGNLKLYERREPCRTPWTEDEMP
jgi:tetratricopeptide (TPR) repeat protein